MTCVYFGYELSGEPRYGLTGNGEVWAYNFVLYAGHRNTMCRSPERHIGTLAPADRDRLLGVAQEARERQLESHTAWRARCIRACPTAPVAPTPKIPELHSWADLLTVQATDVDVAIAQWLAKYDRRRSVA